MPGRGRVITEIKKLEKYPRNVSIYLDGEFWKNLSLEVAVSLELEKGQEIDTKEIEIIIRTEEKKRALNYSLRFLGTRSRSKEEIRERLVRYRIDKDIIEDTIRQLEKQGYLDDKAFARAWIHDRFILKYLGKNRVRQELIAKGISKEIIDEEFSAYSDRDERERAKYIAKKRYKAQKEEDIEKQSRRMYRYLMSKGFSSSISSEIVRKLWKENSDTLNNEDAEN